MTMAQQDMKRFKQLEMTMTQKDMKRFEMTGNDNGTTRHETI